MAATGRPEPLHIRIGKLRDKERAERTDAPASGREEVDEIDGTLRLAANLSAQGIRGAERRQALKGVRPGTTVTGRGVTKRVLTPEAKHARAMQWAGTLTEGERHAFLMGDKFDELPEAAQMVIQEAFTETDDAEYQATLVPELNLGAEVVDVDAIVAMNPDGDEDEDYEAELLDPDPWEGDTIS